MNPFKFYHIFKFFLIVFLLPFSSLAETDSIGHLYVERKADLVGRFLKIINDEMPSSFAVVADSVPRVENRYKISLIETGLPNTLSEKQTLYLCIFDYLLKSKKGDYNILLTSRNSSVLIADAKRKRIDISDIERFETVEWDPVFHYSSQTVLIHELIEQFHLQNIQGVKSSKPRRSQLEKAHNFANQKEANYFNVMMNKIESWIYDKYFYVAFESRVDHKVHFYYIINHSSGNITNIKKYFIN